MIRLVVFLGIVKYAIDIADLFTSAAATFADPFDGAAPFVMA